MIALKIIDFVVIDIRWGLNKQLELTNHQFLTNEECQKLLKYDI